VAGELLGRYSHTLIYYYYLINNIVPQIERLPYNLIYPTTNRIIEHYVYRKYLILLNRLYSLYT
jgi:hypothetical protein